MKRKLTLEQARARYPNRYTMEHVPGWVRRFTGCENGFYAPQFRTDAEWYANTTFPGEPDHPAYLGRHHCYTRNQTWPLGQWLKEPYRP